ncbi:hypothetical protein AVW09_03350 [Microbacterium sp. T32]|nr:hypothetical protein AVW09_03350 [Microbacterium sp. T32]
MLEVIISLVGGAIVAIVIERLYQRWRADADDFELWLNVNILTLMAEEGDRFETGMRYVVDGAEVERPHVIDVDLWNAGAKDIRPDMFSAGAPIEVALGVHVIKELKGGRDHNTDSAAIALGLDNTVRIAPSLLKRGMVKRYRLLVDGTPELTWTNQVADLQIRDLDQEWETPTLDRRIARIAARVIFILLGVIFFGGMLVLPFLPDGVRLAIGDALPQPLGLFVLLPGAVLALGMGIFMYGANASRRPRRAVKVRNRGLAKSPKTSSEMLIRPRDVEYLD